MPTASLTERVDLQPSTTSRRGVLANAEPIPGGVEHDIAVVFSGCVEPIVRDKCIVDVPDEASRPEIATFKVFPIESASECSTLSGLDHVGLASRQLAATTEWAMGRQLSEDIVGNGSPSFADATLLGTVAAADFVAAVSCLEQAAADQGFGTEFMLHAPYRAAAYLKRFKMIDSDGLSPTGHRWIVSPGYAVGGPTTVRLWATGVVWAAEDDIQVNDAVERRQNTDSAYALGAGLVAFDPCLNIAIDITVPACPV